MYSVRIFDIKCIFAHAYYEKQVKHNDMSIIEWHLKAILNSLSFLYSAIFSSFVVNQYAFRYGTIWGNIHTFIERTALRISFNVEGIFAWKMLFTL